MGPAPIYLHYAHKRERQLYRQWQRISRKKGFWHPYSRLAKSRYKIFKDYRKRAFGLLPGLAGAWQPSKDWLRWPKEFREDWSIDKQGDLVRQRII